MTKIHLKYGSKIFCDATFKTCPSFVYQLFITRVYDIVKNSYYTTPFTLMNGKTKEDYYLVFRKLNEHISHFLEIGELYELEEIHMDFEIRIGEACRMVYPEVNIKYFIWHMKRALNLKKMKFVKKKLLMIIAIFYIICFVIDIKYLLNMQ